MTDPKPQGELLLYQTEDGLSRIEVRLVDESVWLSLKQLAELFQRDKSVISRHLKSVFESGELNPDRVVANYATTAADGKTYRVDFYSLDAVIAVGYRVRSHRGTQFRQWATERLSEYIVKGFSLDDTRLKATDGSRYFEELLERIRDIRSSEKVFWRKILDIFATSVDYDADTDAAQEFFKTVQNKMHWAAHGHTAAELINERADAERPNMGLTTWSGARPRKHDIRVAKNYLNAEELDTLNRMVTAYLEFAELQARNRRAMAMRDWAVKLDQFLNISERDILTHAGTISHEVAMLRAETEYEKFNQARLNEPSRAEKDFEQAAKRIERTAPKPPGKRPGPKKGHKR